MKPRSPANPSPEHFARGSFTVTKTGSVLVSTLPLNFPLEKMEAIGRLVVFALASAAELGTPLVELAAHYAGLEIRARDLAGGAIVYLNPQEF